MYTNPQLGGDQRRDMLARADRQRRAERSEARKARQAESPERRPSLAHRMMAKLRIRRLPLSGRG